MYGGKWGNNKMFEEMYQRSGDIVPTKIKIAFSPLGKVLVKLARLLK